MAKTHRWVSTPGHRTRINADRWTLAPGEAIDTHRHAFRKLFAVVAGTVNDRKNDPRRQGENRKK